MKIFDTIFYAIYRFGRSLGQPEGQAYALATVFMPGSFYMVAFFTYIIVVSKIDPHLLPKRGFKPIFLGIAAVLFVISFFIYEKRRKRILEYDRLKNQKFYVWFGAVFLIVMFSFPLLMWFVLRAVMK